MSIFSFVDFPQHILGNEALAKVLRENVNYLIPNEKLSKRQAIYNCRVDSLNYASLSEQLEEMFAKQKKAFKINISFSFVLKNNSDDSYRFYYGSSNNSLFSEPQVIADREGFDTFLGLLREQDILASIREHRPSSKWVFYLVTNMVVKLTFLEFTLG